MKPETLLHLILEEDGYENFITKGSGLSQSIARAMDIYKAENRKGKASGGGNLEIISKGDGVYGLKYKHPIGELKPPKGRKYPNGGGILELINKKEEL